MGSRTLADFREDLSVVDGMRGNSNRWLDRRVNSGYIEVATASRITHEELRERFSLSTITDQEAYPVEAGIIGIEQVTIQDLPDPFRQGRYLAFTGDIDQYERELDPSIDSGQPKVWTLEGRSLRLRPIPDDVYSLEYIAYREPDLLTADGDATVLDARWDQAVHLMAVHYALMDLGQSERADAFFNRARLYMDTRIQDGSERRSTHHVPMASPNSFGEMVRTRRVP